MFRFLRGFLRAPPLRALVPAGPGPEPLRLPPGPGGENPIHRLLDEIGLPWRTPRAELERRYGNRRDPAYGSEMVSFDDVPPVVDGMLRPLSAQVSDRYAPQLPITRFIGHASFGDDAHDNLRRTAARLAARFGPATIGRSWNTLVCGWACGAASVGLIAWPDEWQSDHLPNPAHERDPRLASACHVTILTGFRPALTPEERGWLDGFVPVAPIEGNRLMTPERLRNSPAGEHELEFVREPPARLDHLFGRMGRSAGGEALIYCLDQLHLVPADVILRFRVDRMLPAKGGGGATLLVECATGIAADPVKRLTVTSAGDPDGLNGTGAAMARALGKPLILGEYGYDV